jgi:hypothetical protein
LRPRCQKPSEPGSEYGANRSFEFAKQVRGLPDIALQTLGFDAEQVNL